MKQKNFLWSLLTMVVGVLSIGFSSCGSDDEEIVPPAVPELSVNGFTITFDAKGETDDEIVVTANNTDWSVSVETGKSWLTAGKNGNKLSLMAKENSETADRKGSLLITATANAQLSYTIQVTQKGTAPYLTVNGSDQRNSSLPSFPGLFGSGKSGIDYKLVVKIKSNVEWTLSGQTDWLNVSPTAGNGDVDLSIYPLSENDKVDARTATLTLQGKGVSKTIEVTQDGGKPDCYVLPQNEVALYDRICWEYSATSNVNTFQWMILSEKEINRMTERELLEEITGNNKLKFADDYINFTGYDSHNTRISENSTYYIVTIAYDEDNQAGELKRTKIKTPGYLNENDDAWVSFDNVNANWSTGFWFDVTKEGYCNTYHLIYGVDTETHNSAIYAFEINYYLKNKKKHWFAANRKMEIVTDYPNSHTFTFSTNQLSTKPICIAYGWGVFKNGDISSDIIGFQWDANSTSAKRYSSRSTDAPQPTLLGRAEDAAHVRMMRR